MSNSDDDGHRRPARRGGAGGVRVFVNSSGYGGGGTHLGGAGGRMSNYDDDGHRRSIGYVNNLQLQIDGLNELLHAEQKRQRKRAAIIAALVATAVSATTIVLGPIPTTILVVFFLLGVLRP